MSTLTARAVFIPSENADALASAPVGVFDSGVGGLSVLQEIRRQLPQERLLYVADSAHAPYGDKPESFITARSLAICEFLLSQGAKSLVVACNTATGAAAAVLRAAFAVPIIAMEPAVKPAAGLTRTGVVGVLATRRTLAGEKFNQLVRRFSDRVDIIPQPCPGLVEQVEAGDLESPKTRALLERYVAPLLARKADMLVLGCTHYPFLTPLIREIAGADAAVIDSSEAIARELRRRLAERGLLAGPAQAGGERFYCSREPTQMQTVMNRLWAGEITSISLF